MKKEKNSILLGILVIVIVVLVLGFGFMFVKYERLEDRYEDREDYVDDDTVNDNSVKEDDLKYIKRDSALDIVLGNLGISKSDVHDLDIELEKKYRYDNPVYEISFDYNFYEYEYYVDATNGDILDSFVSRD